jgi:eukaryotic-like serine/threonine-protein kinase
VEDVSAGDATQVLLDRYRLDRSLAADHLLEVWLARDLRLRRRVVVKLLRPRWVEDPEALDRFRFEALTAAQLVHQHIACTYDVEVGDEAVFTVSEFVEGPTLTQLLGSGALDPLVVAALGAQASLGLAAAHEEGLVHRAVCPENLVVGADGRLRLVDFGAVAPTPEEGGPDQAPEPVFPEPGVTVYRAPELLAGVDPDGPADVYSLGLVLTEALTGASAAEIAAAGGATLRSAPRRAGARARLEQLLAGAMGRTPGARPTAAELAAELAALCGGPTREVIQRLVADQTSRATPA